MVTLELNEDQTEMVVQMHYRRMNVKEWLDNEFPDFYIRDIKVIAAFGNTCLPNSTMDRKVVVYGVSKTNDDKFREQMLHFIGNLKDHVKDTITLRQERLSKGLCPECGQNVSDWKPVFGAFAPEWWATMRERGIYPATGHKENCPIKFQKS